MPRAAQFNCGEAVNAAFIEWIPRGRFCVDRCAAAVCFMYEGGAWGVCVSVVL